MRSRFLLYRNRRREPFYMIDIRLFHHRQELTRVGRERLNIAALPLGIKRVEGERRFPRTRKPRYHH